MSKIRTSRSPEGGQSQRAEIKQRAETKKERVARAEQVCERLIRLEHSLRHPEIPNAVRGIEGINKAHDMLVEREEYGLLIGGLATSLYHPQADSELLTREHKDIDVMVFRSRFRPKEPFEGGIDWWTSHQVEELQKDPYGNETKNISNYWQNGHGIILQFGFAPYGLGKHGLYIPGQAAVLSMREIELRSGLLNRSLELDEKLDNQDIENGLQLYQTKLYDHMDDSPVKEEVRSAGWGTGHYIRELSKREQQIVNELKMQK